jgi:hypothetical protein
MIANIKEEAIKRNEQKQQDKTKKSQATDGTSSELSVLSLTDTDKGNKTTAGLMESDEGNHEEEELDLELLRRLSECMKYHQVLLQ